METLEEEMPSYWNPDTQGIDVLEKLNYFSTFPFLWLDLTASIDKVKLIDKRISILSLKNYCIGSRTG